MKTGSILAVCFVSIACAGIPENAPISLIEFSGSTSDVTYSTNPLQSLRALVFHFAAEAKCKKTPGLMGSQLPDVPEDICRAIESLGETQEKDVMADIAAVLVRYTNANSDGRGVIVDRKHPLVQSFMSAMKPVLPGDEIISSSLADWICTNRNTMGHSTVLDKEIKEYGKMKKRLQIKYERLAEEGLRSLEKKSVPDKP